MLLLATVPTGPGVTLADGMLLNRSEVVRAPLVTKSCVLRLVTGTPTATAPRMSEPVISTVSGTSISACPTCACATCWACALIALANVSNDAVPNNVVSLDVFGFIFPPRMPIRLSVRCGRVSLLVGAHAVLRPPNAGGTTETLHRVPSFSRFHDHPIGNATRMGNLILPAPGEDPGDASLAAYFELRPAR